MFDWVRGIGFPFGALIAFEGGFNEVVAMIEKLAKSLSFLGLRQVYGYGHGFFLLLFFLEESQTTSQYATLDLRESLGSYWLWSITQN
jgi:hypothetical protein